ELKRGKAEIDQRAAVRCVYVLRGSCRRQRNSNRWEGNPECIQQLASIRVDAPDRTAGSARHRNIESVVQGHLHEKGKVFIGEGLAQRSVLSLRVKVHDILTALIGNENIAIAALGDSHGCRQSRGDEV